MSKVIQNPCINRVESEKKFITYLKKYNATGITLAHRLRDTHQSLFAKLCAQLDKQFQDESKLQGDAHQIDLELGVKLSTNSFILAKFLSCAPSTIRLRINRLKEAGIILRVVNHGKLRPIDIIFDPRYLEIDPVSVFFSKYSKPVYYNPQNSSSAEVCSSQDHYNNKIMLRNEESEADWKVIVSEGLAPASDKHVLLREHDKESSALLREGTQDQNSFSQEHRPMGTKNQAALEYFEKIKTKEEAFRAQIIFYAAYFLAIAIEKYKFWENRKDNLTLFDLDRQPLIETIANTYFSKCTTDAELTKTMNIYTARFEMVASYRRRKHWDVQWPANYFDVNNPTGFASTSLWYKKAKEARDKKELAKPKTNNNDRLLKAVKRLTKDPSRKMFERAYIFNKCPQLLPQFDRIVTQLSKTAKAAYIQKHTKPNLTPKE